MMEVGGINASEMFFFNKATGDDPFKLVGTSNKMTEYGIRDKGKKAIAVAGQNEPDTAFRRKCRMTPVVSLSNHGRH